MISRALIFFIVPVVLSFGQARHAEVEYIAKYKDLAIEESKRVGIPVSIKLAQGIVESDSGRSVLASRAKNHFGIKCKSWWDGSKYYYVDDETNHDGEPVPSCFRMYETVTESYRDHSDFIVTSVRYNHLLELPATNYKGWANGLKLGGYATEGRYAEILIDVIEEFDLDAFDKAISE